MQRFQRWRFRGEWTWGGALRLRRFAYPRLCCETLSALITQHDGVPLRPRQRLCRNSGPADQGLKVLSIARRMENLSGDFAAVRCEIHFAIGSSVLCFSVPISVSIAANGSPPPFWPEI